MECDKCGEELFRIKGLCLDRDEMREAAYCFDCHILYKVTAHGLCLVRKPILEGNCAHQKECCFHEREEK